MRVLCIVTDTFEELEAVGTIALLRRAEIDVDVYALHATQATGRFAITLSSLHNLDDVNLAHYDALFLPGGPHYQVLEASKTVLSIISDFMKQNKIVAAICAAPTILGRLGYLKNKHYTCFPSMNEHFQGTYHATYTVTDGNLITGCSAAATIDFAFALIQALAGQMKAQEVKNAIYYKNKQE